MLVCAGTACGPSRRGRMVGRSIASQGGPAVGHRDHTMADREARVAVAIAAGLYVVGAALIATSALLPHVSSTIGVVAVAGTALLTAAGPPIPFSRPPGGGPPALFPHLLGGV